MDEKGLSKNFWCVFLVIFSFLIIGTALGFFVFANRKSKVIEKEENGGRVVLNYTNNIKGLSIKDAVPVADAIGIKNDVDGEYFDFSVNVSLDEAANIEYEICAIKDEKKSTISDDDIKIYLEQEKSGSYSEVFGPSKFVGIKNTSKLGSPKGSMILTKVKKSKSTTDNYRLRIWLSDQSLIQKGDYSIEILVNGIAK